MIETSLEAYREVTDNGVMRTQVGRILQALDEHGDSTAQELGVATGLGNHTVTRRRSLLIRSGCVEQGVKRPCKVTGRSAYPLSLTSVGVGVLLGGDVPVPGPSKRDLELAVLKAARGAVEHNDGWAYLALREAVQTLDQWQAVGGAK